MSDPPNGPEPIPIPESDDELLAQCRIDTFRAGGKGGQHQNKTETGVRLVHLASGITASSRRHRSQALNRQAALDRLRAELEELNRPSPTRVSTKVPTRERRARLEEKRRRAKLKRLRRKPEKDD
jgi:ribosome-associated protein